MSTAIQQSLQPAAATRPVPTTLVGKYISVVPLNAAEHAAQLWEGTSGPTNDSLWRFLSEGPFSEFGDFAAMLETKAASQDPLFFSVLDNTSQAAVGYVALMRVEPAHKCVEVGNILFTPALQRTRGATECMYLLARHVFEDLQFRRYEWKCNALNLPSRQAALRFGFTFEGIFRQHMIVKARNRDTAWFSMLDGEWPERKENFERWLHPSNFDAAGKQRLSLSTLNGKADAATPKPR